MTKTQKENEFFQLTMTVDNLYDLIEICQDYYKKSKQSKKVKSTIDRLKFHSSILGGVPKHYKVSVELNGIQLDTVEQIVDKDEWKFKTKN